MANGEKRMENRESSFPPQTTQPPNYLIPGAERGGLRHPISLLRCGDFATHPPLHIVSFCLYSGRKF